MSAAGSGPPLLLIMGMSGTALHWGEPFLDVCGATSTMIVYDHRGVGASSRLEGPITIAQLAEDAAGPARRPGARLRARAGHLDGRDGRPGARAGSSRAHPHADARLHLLRRRGQRAAPPEVIRRLAEGDDVRRPRARDPRRLGGNVSPSFAANDDAYARFLEIGAARAVPVEVIMAQMRAIAEHDTSARLPADRVADARDPRHARSDAARSERPYDRRADTRARAWRSSTGLATCSSGSSPSARPSWCARTPPCMPDPHRAEHRHRRRGAAGRRRRSSAVRTGDRRRSCCCTA